jgi:hypothetical protein
LKKLLFIIRVKWDLKRVYINGCRYNERLNTETEGSKTSRIHWVVWVNTECMWSYMTVEIYLDCNIHVDTLVSRWNQSETGGSGSDNQWTCVHVWVSRIGTERVQTTRVISSVIYSLIH